VNTEPRSDEPTVQLGYAGFPSPQKPRKLARPPGVLGESGRPFGPRYAVLDSRQPVVGQRLARFDLARLGPTPRWSSSGAAGATAESDNSHGHRIAIRSGPVRSQGATYDPARWHDAYVMLGGAAAVLTGLVVVAAFRVLND
jgi:hypothetical protein